MPKFTLLGLLLPPAPPTPSPFFFLPICQITWFGKHLIVHCMTLMFDISFLLQLKKKIKKLKLGEERRFLHLLKICFCHLFSCVGLLFCKRGFFFLIWKMGSYSVLILPLWRGLANLIIHPVLEWGRDSLASKSHICLLSFVCYLKCTVVVFILLSVLNHLLGS